MSKWPIAIRNSQKKIEDNHKLTDKNGQKMAERWCQP